MDDEKDIELSEKRAMVYLPENAVEININAKVYDNKELIDVLRTLNMQDIKRAFDLAEENYIEDDDVFELTDCGKEIAKTIIKNCNEDKI